AVSPDGQWLAVGGLGLFQTASRTHAAGRMYPYTPPSGTMLREQATIYLFNTQTHAVSVLQGHKGEICQLAFAPSRPGKPPLLVSAAREPGNHPERADNYAGRVSLWDIRKAAHLDNKGKLVDGGAPLATHVLRMEYTRLSLGLAIRHTGAQPRQVRVAIAWGDGMLRTWDADVDALQEVQDGIADKKKTVNITVAYLPGDRQFVTSSVYNDGGWLCLWNDVPGKEPVRASWMRFEPARDYNLLPRGLALIRGDEGKPNLAAVALQAGEKRTGAQAYWLELVDLGRMRHVSNCYLCDLPRNQFPLPVLAASPDGKYLAAAGNPNHEIDVHSVADLRAKPERLGGPGTIIRSLAFIRSKQGRLGLLLREASGGAHGRLTKLAETDYVFDFGGRLLSAQPAQQGWSIASPAQDGRWIEEFRPSNQVDAANIRDCLVIWRSRNGRSQTTVRLDAREFVTDYALLPAPILPAPILAVASWHTRINQPLLHLFRADNGEEVRQYRGHTMPIRCLAASPDGRLLASAADDQTVCLWSLANLDMIVGKKGSLTGVLIARPANKLVVQRVRPGNPASDRLQSNDELEGLWINGVAKPGALASPLQFYNAIWDQRPGTTVTLTIVRGGARQAVDVRVGQGVDEQKPLLSLFTQIKGASREWIAWTPTGPYDVSSRNIERYLGWHFNPDRLEAPVRFAPASVHRNQFLKPRLLGPLVFYADINKAFAKLAQEPPLPINKPDLSLDVVSSDGSVAGEDEHGQVLVREPKLTLGVRVTGATLDGNQVASLTWQLDQDAAHEFDLTQASGQELSVPISLSRGRGTHTITVHLRTNEKQPQNVTRPVTVRYQPQAPHIQWNDAGLHKAVKVPAFDIRASVKPGQDGQQFDVWLSHDGVKQAVNGANVKERIQLHPGQNIIELFARNRNALLHYENAETEVETLVIALKEGKAPTIRLENIAFDKPEAGSLDVRAGQLVRVGAARLHLRASIQSEDQVPKVKLRRGKVDTNVPVTKRDGKYDVDVPLALIPGPPQTVELIAEAAGKKVTSSLNLVYVPPVPEFTWSSPDEDLALVEHKDKPLVHLQGSPAQSNEFPFQVRIEVKNKKSKGGVVPQKGNQTRIVRKFTRRPNGSKVALDEELSIGPGDNDVEVTVSNDWQSGPVQHRHVILLSPPVLLTSGFKLRGKEPFADINITARSAADLPLTTVRITPDLPPPIVRSNDLSYPAKKVGAPGKDGVTWSLRIPRLFLAKGNNAFKIFASNTDGECLESKRLTIPYNPPPAEPAVLEIDKPREAKTKPICMVPFTVRSASKIQAVELQHEGSIIWTADVRRQVQDNGGWLLRDQLKLDLAEGPNLFEMVAV
ncbi:MAG TPA: hypothetical protein VFA18_14845, partial [Gemmataceae bacterium]|nr:hypothetical protein [Gemmataceae bacterium]